MCKMCKHTHTRQCFYCSIISISVVKRICSKKGHRVEEKSLRVSPYFECEGGAIWNTEIHVLKIPDSIDLPYESNYLTLLKRYFVVSLIIYNNF